ncbi:MAG: hypothetical protein KDK28_11805 [Maritimibacter sp.]|nr:hypothetical protein [Maritimibacter sp.]
MRATEIRPRFGAGTRRDALGVAAVALWAAFGVAQPAQAAGAGGFVPPSGCESFATVQNRACSVSVMWRCEVAPEGAFWEANFSFDGLESIVNYDGEYQWLDAAYSWDSSREEFSPPAADRISRGDLLATGIDTFDFTMHRVTPDRRYDIRVVGADMLTGATATIDGYTLDEVATRLEIIDDEGVVEYASKGTQYYSRDLGLFFYGAEDVFSPEGDVSTYDDRPADIILPGEPGFGDTEPLYGCNLQDAALTPSRAQSVMGSAS